MPLSTATDYNTEFKNHIKNEAEETLEMTVTCPGDFTGNGEKDFTCGQPVILQGPYRSPYFHLTRFDKNSLTASKTLGVTRTAATDGNGTQGALECLQEKFQIEMPEYDSGHGQYHKGVRMSRLYSWDKEPECQFMPSSPK